MPAVILPGVAVGPDIYNGGPASISAVITQLGVPVRKQVVLLSWPALNRVASTWSASDGTYSFLRLRIQSYLIATVDETGTYTPEAKIVTPA